MKEFESNLFTIRRNVMNGVNSKVKDWDAIIKELVGKDDVTTINNIYDFVCENFSFGIEKGAEGYVYFGTVNSDGTTRAYQVIEGIVNSSDGAYGYISSTEAGKIFNDLGFMSAVKNNLKDSSLKVAQNNPLFDGNVKNGVATGIIELSDGTSVQAFNDFFSANYVKNLKCSNVNTLLSGDRIENCFSRTEFEALLDNASIKTINGIDKNVFYDLYCAAPSGKEVDYVCDAIKASEISILKDKYYCIVDGKVQIVSKQTEGAVSLIDTLLANNNIVSPSTSSIDDILASLGDTLPVESRDALKNLSRNSDMELAQILIHNSDDILEISGRKSLDLGKYSIETGGKITETLADGTRVKVDLPEFSSVEDAIVKGCKVIDGPEGTYFVISKNSITKLIDSADNIMLVIEIGKELHNTCLKGQTLIQNKPSIPEGYFSESLEKA